MKKDFILDQPDGQVADASVFNAKFCAVDRIQFPRRSNLTEVANDPPLLRP